MGRWEPDARGRMILAALELYAERGYEQTTVADIAERAGVTERTFFRHFADKREVLFDGANELQETVVAAITAAPPEASPIDAVALAMGRAAELLEQRRDFARQRAAVVAGTPSLRERELLKMAALGAASGEALRGRGVQEPTATLAGEAGVTIFRVGFGAWVADDTGLPFPEHIRAALSGLRAATLS